jgi:5-methylcytosine-specific restriction endonuclease McrA
MKRAPDSEQRARLMERSGGRCMICGGLPDWRGLAIHHLELRQMGGTRRVYTDDDLAVVCGRCHSQFHGIREG